MKYGRPGVGNIEEGPIFENPVEGNYRLDSGSPRIDAGDPEYIPPFGGGCRIDRGAYEFDKDFNCF